MNWNQNTVGNINWNQTTGGAPGLSNTTGMIHPQLQQQPVHVGTLSVNQQVNNPM